MKKLALINLILLLAVKSISACDHPNYVEIINENLYYRKLYFYSSVFLIIANFLLFFVRKQHDYAVLVIIIISTIIAAMVTFAGAIISGADCGDGLRAFLGLDLIYFILLTVFHLGLWLGKGNLRFSKKELP